MGILFFFNPHKSLSQSTTLKDSLELLLSQSTSADKKYDYILRLVINAGLDKNDLDYYLSEGLVQAGKLKSHYKKDTILRYAAYQYLKLGEKDKVVGIYNTLDSLGEVHQDPLLIGGALLGMSTLYEQNGEIDKAIAKMNESLDYFKKGDSDFDIANALNMLTTVHRKRGNVDEAIEAADSALYYINKNPMRAKSMEQLLVTSYSNLGNIYRSSGDNAKALENFKKAESYALNLSDRSYLGVIYNNLGNISHITGSLDEAIDYYLKSIQIKQEHNDSRGMAIGYHNLGAIEFDLGDYESARKYLMQSDEISVDQNIAVLRIYNYNKFGSISLKQDSSARARDEFQLAINLSDSLGFIAGKITALQGLGESNLNLKKYSEAYKCFEEGLNLAVEKQSKPNESSLLVLMAELYMRITQDNITIQGLNNRVVEKYLLRSLELAREMNNMDNKLATQKALGLFYQSTNQNNKSLKYLNDYIILRDSFFNKQRIELTREMQVKYETAEKEKEIIQLEADKEIANVRIEKNRNIFISIVGALLFTLILAIQYVRQRSRVERKKQYELFRSKLSAELHDDIGTILTGVAMHSELLSDTAGSDSKKTAQMIADMSRKAMGRMRDTVWAIDARKDTIGDLSDRMLDFAEEVLSARQIRIFFDTKSINSDTHVRPEIRQNTYLIFKEAIANIAKHSSASEVKIDLKINKNNLYLCVHDNGKLEDVGGFKTSGLGLENIRMRVQQLNGQVRIENQNGFKLSIEIPI